MKATGIVRRIDDLGRVVIPKEIRRTMRIKEGDPLEIFTDRGGEIILKKYSPIKELSEFASEYAESLYETLGFDCVITDADSIVAVSGVFDKEYLSTRINSDLESIIEKRIVYNSLEEKEVIRISIEQANIKKYISQVIVPIISQGDPIGTIIFMSQKGDAEIGEVEINVLKTAANFLAKQMES